MLQGTRRAALLLACCAALAGAGACREADPSRYNVILVSVDTLRADRLNAYGYTRRQTSPNLDRLARDGILFENHVAASPWTIPSHMSLFTSLHPTGHGMTRAFGAEMAALASGAEYDRLDESTPTLPEILTGTGRATAAFTGGVTLDPRIGFSRGFETYETNMYKLNHRKVGRMLRWIEAHRDRPFFLFWHTFETHAPYLQTTFVDEVLPAAQATSLALRLEELGRVPGPKSTRAGRDILQELEAFTPEVCDALYDGGVLSFDSWLGVVLDALRSRGLYDRTLVVLTSDHGEQLGEERQGVVASRRFYNSHGRTLFEELVHVPLVVKLPRSHHAGTRVSAVTRSVDVMPTILDVVSAPPLSTASDGASLRPAWEGGREFASRPALSESLSEPHEKKSLRTERYKYIVSTSDEEVLAHGRDHVPERPRAVELYDLLEDPRETHDLLRTLPPPSADLVARLDRVLRVQLARKGRAGSGSLDAETLEALRTLGYVH